MKITKNITIAGKHGKPILTDVFFIENQKPKPILIFCHGYKGFKDWGAWDLMANAFAENGFFFIKFNFAFNGGTPEQPIDFPDLEAFGNNNYTKELDDLETIINWISENSVYKNEIDTNSINVMGHSRAGGIVSIKSEKDSRIKKVISLAGVSDYANRYPISGDAEQWKKDGVKYVENGRTKQQMPHFYQFYEDFITNSERLDIKRAVSKLKKPFLIIHGDEDTSVLIEEANNLHSWKPDSVYKTIEGANHVFGASHPWEKSSLPTHLKEVVETTSHFLK
ncbi:alpha/beta fold hydrolase [Tamlana sp. 2_MG-2023]|uniref:alpha/beta hydrolase family protein n=1 Tax=unclassified Tamlana TaxID=2614803 RepID=UPI0026E1F671|nr:MULTISPECIES: alpha/beta fold hydrolase [unclassified Tamlana]MDO6761128.1 alpha/beta fold hydrolase [Tamlana sp. 2_MG-2023]MDO6791539.1 alpha/beta fold hydrolase [Tamlana sp. 1_MG-2023]